jgi:hypothetical protein
MTPQMAFALSQAGISAVAEMFRSYQCEETRREWIRTHYAALLEKVRLEQENLLRYYEMKFKERREGLEHFYLLLHEAVDTGNDLHLQAALYGILDIIKTDPLADYDQFLLAMQDPDTRLEI